MVTQQQETPRSDAARETEQLNAEIGEHVLHTLGRPRELHSVQVRPLWNDRYRVNVFVGADVVTARIAHSYFLIVDREGSVIAATPKITKEY